MIDKNNCKHRDHVMWNPFNGVVQCHVCGIVFTPLNDREEDYCLKVLEQQILMGTEEENNKRLNAKLLLHQQLKQSGIDLDCIKPGVDQNG